MISIWEIFLFLMFVLVVVVPIVALLSAFLVRRLRAK